jgi:glycine dehydrogenase
MGLTQSNTHFFDTLKIGLNNSDAASLRGLAEDAEINFNYIDAKTVGVSLNETTTDTDVAEIIAVFAAAE